MLKGEICMKRSWLIVGLLTVFAGFALAQSSGQNATTQGTESKAPAGTVTKEQHTEAVVEPANKPVKVTPDVVKSAQQRLADKNYNPGPADGRMGPQTRAALRKFQADEGLTPTGRLDQSTLGKLNVGATQQFGAAPGDIGRGGKAAGHDVKEGHPVAAGKAMGKGTAHAAKKVARGTKSGAVTLKDKTGEGMSAIGNKVSGKSEKEKNEEQNQNPK